MRDRWYIGLASTMHDPALAIVDAGGRVMFAEATERRLQSKRAYDCPPDDLIHVVELVRAHVPDDAALVVAPSWSDAELARLEQLAGGERRHRDAVPLVREDPFAWPFPRPGALATTLRNSVSGAGLNLLTTLQLAQPATLRGQDHHLAHAAHAVWSSPFDECAVAIVDGFGESGSTSAYAWRGGMPAQLPASGEAAGSAAARPASLGFFYARLCALCGFDPVKGEEWKVMGLAGFGSADPVLYALLQPLVAVAGTALVAGCTPAEECSRIVELRALAREMGETPRARADLARTGQLVFEEVLSRLLVNVHAATGLPSLAYAGGCALNSSCNGRLLGVTPFDALHVPSAPADDGTAIGAALLAWCEDHPGETPPRADSPYLGSRVNAVSVANLERFGGLPLVRLGEEALAERVAALLDDGRIVGWMQGEAEFGPRALGHRSVLADPRPATMQDHLNARVKFREEFRPFAPAVLDERGNEWFDDYQPSRYMERTLRFRAERRGEVPAVVHVDGTGRAQSVRRAWEPRFHAVVEAFERRTGIPMLLNTSLNVMGRPIVHALEDALGMLFTTGLDALVVDDLLVSKPGMARSSA